MKIFVSGMVYTKSGMRDAFVVDQGRFIYVENQEEAMRYGGDVIDLEGRFVCAGFNDSHMHLLNYGYTLGCFDLSECTDGMEHMIHSFRSFANKMKKQKWIVGRGFNQDYFQDSRRLPNRYDLDQVDSERPVVAVRACGHVWVINSRALERIDLTQVSKIEGGLVDRDQNGCVLGIFRENAISLIQAQMPSYSVEDLKEMIVRAAHKVNQYGITSVQSDDFCALPAVSFEMVIEAYQSLVQEGRLTVRVNEQCQFTNQSRFQAFLDKYKDSFVSEKDKGQGVDAPFFKLGPLKIVGDGSLGARTACMLKPYHDAPMESGIEIYSTDELKTLISMARKEKMSVCIHAIGDQTMEHVLDAYAAVLTDKEDHRCGIVHCQIMTPDQYERLAQMRLYAYIQSVFLDYDQQIVKARVGLESAMSSYNFKKMLDFGVNVSNGSDAPVEDPNPLRGIQCAVTRKSLDGKYGPYLLDQALSVNQALNAYTYAGAKASFEEKAKGDICEGMAADFTILEQNPFTVLDEEIGKIKVYATWLNGHCVYRKSSAVTRGK